MRSTIAIVDGSGGLPLNPHRGYSRRSKRDSFRRAALLQSSHGRARIGCGRQPRQRPRRFAHVRHGQARCRWSLVWSSAMQVVAGSGEIEDTVSWRRDRLFFREIGAGRPGVITRGDFGRLSILDSAAVSSMRTPLKTSLNGSRSAATSTCASSLSRSTLPSSWRRPPTIAEISPRAVNPRTSTFTLSRLAAHNSGGGKVIAQVKGKSDSHVPARLVRVPGVMVDITVETPSQRQCAISDYDATLSGESLGVTPDAEMPDGMRLIVAERAAQELGTNQVSELRIRLPGSDPRSTCGTRARLRPLGLGGTGHSQGTHARWRDVRHRAQCRRHRAKR